MCQGAVSVDGDTVTRNLAYYAMAHFSKFVRPGSVRIESTESKDLPNVAFANAGGKVILVVANTSKSAQTFVVSCKGLKQAVSLAAQSAATYIIE